MAEKRGEALSEEARGGIASTPSLTERIKAGVKRITDLSRAQRT